MGLAPGDDEKYGSGFLVVVQVIVGAQSMNVQRCDHESRAGFLEVERLLR